MNIVDINRWLRHPDGYTFDSVHAEGAYLCVTYIQTIVPEETTQEKGWNTVRIYLNDTGREVLRTEDEQTLLPVFDEPKQKVEPIMPSRWYRFRNGFLIALQGLQEMVKCLKRL